MKKIFSAVISFLLIMTFLTAAYADQATTDEPQKPTELTVAEAAELAIANSSNIKKLYETIESTAKKRKDQITDRLSTTYIPSGDEVTFVEDTSLSALLNIMTLEMTNKSNEIEVQLQEEKIMQSIRTMFLSIKNAEQDIKSQKSALQLAKKQLTISEKKLELGMTSQADFSTEKLDYDKKVLDYKNNQALLEKSYVTLNMLIGTDINERYNLILDLEYKPLEDVSLDEYIREKQQTDPNVKKRNNDLTNANYELNIVAPSTAAPYETRRTNYNQALRAVADAKTSVEETIRNVYSDIKKLELTIASNEIDLSKKKEQLIIKELQFKLGRATEIELLLLKNEISQLQISISRNKLDYAMNLIKFEKPYLA